MRRVCDHVLLKPCGEHTVFIEIWKWVTARGKKKKEKENVQFASGTCKAKR